MTSVDFRATTFVPRRRTVLRGGLALGATIGLGGLRPARAADRMLKISYTVSRNSQLGAETFAREMEGATGGRWGAAYTPGDVFGGELDMLKAVRTGELDLMVCSAVALSTVVAAFGIFDLPFLFRSPAQARAALDSQIGQEYLDAFSAHDLVALAWGENGVRHLTNSKHPVRTPADIRGLRLRVPESVVTLRCFRQLGAEAAPLPFPALYGALEAGRFDGQENPLATILNSRFERVQRYLTLTGHVYSGAIFFASKDVWDDLTPDDRAAFRRAARAGGQTMRDFASRTDRDGVGTLRQAGMDVVNTIDRDAFLSALEPVWSEIADRFGKEQVVKLRAVEPGVTG